MNRLFVYALFCSECVVTSWAAAEGPDKESSHRNVSERQPAGPPGETGQRAPRQRRPGAVHRGKERWELFLYHGFTAKMSPLNKDGFFYFAVLRPWHSLLWTVGVSVTHARRVVEKL